jgi:hypothetical protein
MREAVGLTGDTVAMRVADCLERLLGMHSGKCLCHPQSHRSM